MYEQYRIAVIGDFMVDEWWRAESMKICPEAPVPDLINPVLIRRSAGGAGNVARNLLSLDAKVSLYGIIGRDDAGYAIWNELMELGADWKVDPVDGFETHRKIRYCSDGQMVFRVSQDRCRVVTRGALLYDDVDAVIVSDYNKGALHPDIIEKIMKLDAPIFVDPKFDNLIYYKGATLVKFNKVEAVAAMRSWPDTTTYSIARIQEQFQRVNREPTNIVVTLGHVGMEVIDKEGEIYDIPGREVAVSDVTGAGDTAMAVLTLEYLRNGGNIVKAAYLANYACSLVVQKRMTAVVTLEELEAGLDD